MCSQSRADLLTLGLAVTKILTGLISPLGVECRRIYSHLPESVVSKLLWVWESLSDVTCCRSLIIVYDSQCILQIGFANKSSIGDEAVAVDANKLMQGSLYQGVIKSGARKYPAWTQVDCAMQPQGLEMFIGEKLDASLAKNVNNLPLAVQD
uniref:Uncharacterized protein n=1 Tax=Fagus sylvatica TaxID=28930 RepID=A0A2N9ERG0_FAGSY